MDPPEAVISKPGDSDIVSKVGCFSASGQVKSFDDKIGRDNQASKVEKGEKKVMSNYHPGEKQVLTASIPGFFHITRPLITNPKSSDGHEERNCKSLFAIDTATTLKSKPTVMTQSEIASLTNVQAVSTLSSGKEGSAYRKKQSYLPVNSRTAIVLSRPQISASATHTNGLHIQQIPVLNNTKFQFSKPIPVDAACSMRPANDDISSTTLKQAIEPYPNDNVLITDKEKHTPSETSMLPHDNRFENTVSHCRNNNSRVRNTKENDTPKEKMVNLSEDKCTEERLTPKRDKTSKSLGKKVNSEVKFTGNVAHKLPDDETELMKNVKDQFVESVSTSELCYTNPQSEHRPIKKKCLRGIGEATCAALEVDGSNLPSTSNLEIGKTTRQDVTHEQQNFAIVNMHIENDDVANSSNMSDTVPNKTEKSTENTASGCTSLKLDEKDLSNTDNVTEIINRVASGDIFTTKPRKFSKRKQARASKKAKQRITNYISTKELGTEESETKKNVNKLQQPTEEGVQMLRSKHPSKKSSKAKLDIESRYLEHTLTSVSSFEEVLQGESDVINQIETDKLSKVKDHHLLILSDDEREYLRNKCYLDDDLTVDVRRRFEPHVEGKGDKSSPDIIHNGSEDDPDSVQFEAATSSLAVNYKDRMNENQLENIEKETQKDKQNKCHSEFDFKQPVVKLERLGNMPTLKQNQGLESKQPWKQDITLKNTHSLNSTLPSRKVYYVINSNDIVRLQQQQHIAKTAITTSYKTAPEISSTVSWNSNFTIPSASTVSSTINKNSSFTAIQMPKASKHTEFDLKAGKRISVEDSQSNRSGSYSHYVDSNGEFKLKSSPACENLSLPARPYCNKLTVKELLRAKRENKYYGTSKNKEITPNHTHVQLPKKHVFENTPAFITKNVVKDTESRYEMLAAVESSNSNQKSDPESTLHQQINQKKVSTQPGRVLHIVNPSMILAVPTFTQENITTASDSAAPSGLAQPHITQKDNLVSQKETREIQTGSQKKQAVYIKIGDQTMIVKRCESTRGTDKITLPAPKPKYSITDDYKRKHKRSKRRHSQRFHQQSLRSKLRKILQRSNEPVQKLVNTLDLVPVQLLKQFLETTVKEESAGDDLPIDANKSMMSTNRNDVIKAKSADVHEEKHQTKSKSRKRKLSCSYQTKMANIMQISKRTDGTVIYSTHQVQVRYAKVKSAGSFNTCTLCRLKFSVDGFLEKILAESIQQGLFLVQNCKGELACLKKNKKIDAVLLLYPPHIATVPDDSFCIAIGDLFSEEHRNQSKFQTEKNQLKFQTENANIQSVLEKFLWPSSMQNIVDFMDKRYSSVTDRSLSPRCCSPMFYSSKMKDAFDIEESRSSGCNGSGNFASSSFSRQFETANGTFNRQSTRFSERAIALKIKQNELFETCRKLKSERTAKEGNKLSADRGSVSGSFKGVTSIQDGFVEGVRVLIPVVAEQNVLCKETQHCTSTYPQASSENDEVDSNNC